MQSRDKYRIDTIVPIQNALRGISRNLAPLRPFVNVLSVYNRCESADRIRYATVASPSPLILSPRSWISPLLRARAAARVLRISPRCGDRHLGCVKRCHYSSSPFLRWWGDEADLHLKAPVQSSSNSLAREGREYPHPQRIHILGLGNVGIFIAHSLASIPNRPPITLLLKGNNHLKEWRAADGTLRITTRQITESKKGFDYEVKRRHVADEAVQGALGRTFHPSEPSSSRTALSDEDHDSRHYSSKARSGTDGDLQAHLEDPSRASYASSGHCQPITLPRQLEHEPESLRTDDNEIIHHLIVSTKAYATARAIKTYAHRLTKNSTILFLQTGMGVIEEVTDQCFPDADNRPQYMIGVNTHDLRRRGQFFDVTHAGEGTIAIGNMPYPFTFGSHSNPPLSKASISSLHLLRTVTRVPVFVAVGFRPTDLLQQQLDKLAVNAIINPVTAILDVKNGGMDSNFYLTRVMRLLLAEISMVLRNLPELKDIPNVNMRYSTARIEQTVFWMARLLAENDSSMLQDLRRRNQTEIDYINGYIIKRGEQLGLRCVMNYMIMNLVKGKSLVQTREMEAHLPYAPSASLE